jgi:hypothetical protein
MSISRDHWYGKAPVSHGWHSRQKKEAGSPLHLKNARNEVNAYSYSTY